MTEEIKDRIELINRGEVPEGYVHTRAGTMPKDWETTKTASDVFKNYSDKKHTGQGEVLSATQDRGIVPRSEVDIDIKYAEESVSSYKKVENGDFVISLRSFQGGIEYSQYNGLVSPAYTVLKPILPIEVGFYKACFKTTDFINRLNSAVYGIRDGKQIGFSDFGDMILHYPPLPEQQKIAEILTTYDKLIALKKELIAEKQKLKKSYLSKMFPKNGESVPEFRFPGFAGDWEQRELGEVSASYSGGTPSVGTAAYYGGEIPFIRSGEISSCSTELFLTAHGIKNSSAKLVQSGDILYALYGATSGEVSISQINGAINQAILAIKPYKEYDSNFIYQWLKKEKSAITETYLQGGQGNLSGSIIKSLLISFPNNKAEQTAIGTFFKTLDNLINLHQRELEAMENHKKALMQLLLTGIVRVN